MGHRNVTKIPTVMLIQHPSSISRRRTPARAVPFSTHDVNMFIPILVCTRAGFLHHHHQTQIRPVSRTFPSIKYSYKWIKSMTRIITND